MAIGVLWLAPQDSDELDMWSFAHGADHVDIIRRLNEVQPNVMLSSWVLYPFDAEDLGPWIYNHQVMHNEMNQALGIQGQDLTDVDFSDIDSLQGWIYANATEHQQAGQMLGLG